MTRWFRMYDEILDDPKVQKLSDEDFKAWVNLLCLAARNGGALPRIEDVAFALRRCPEAVEALLERMRRARLIDSRGRGAKRRFVPHRWEERQFKSDTSRDRMRRHREAVRDVTVTAAVTPPESESESESESDPPKPPADGGLGLGSDKIGLARELCALAGIARCGPAAIGQVGRWLADGIEAATIRETVAAMCAATPAATRSLKRFDQPVRRAALEPAPATVGRRAMNLDELNAAARWCDDHGEPERAADYRRQAAALMVAARGKDKISGGGE